MAPALTGRPFFIDSWGHSTPAWVTFRNLVPEGIHEQISLHITCWCEHVHYTYAGKYSIDFVTEMYQLLDALCHISTYLRDVLVFLLISHFMLYTTWHSSKIYKQIYHVEQKKNDD